MTRWRAGSRAVVAFGLGAVVICGGALWLLGTRLIRPVNHPVPLPHDVPFDEVASPATIGLDHIPIAVKDLERAAATYRALGFALKPGRDHANGIRNVHVKFPDGAGFELLTAPRAVDALSAHYVDTIRAGTGPAFVSFHARDTRQLQGALRRGDYEFRQEGEITTLTAPEFGDLFLVRDNRSPTDRQEHFTHPNGATALSAVWIATADGEDWARLLIQLGGRQQRRQVLAPDPVSASVVSLATGEVVFLPVQNQVLAGRPVIGASVSVPDLAKVRQILTQAEIEPWVGTEGGERIVVEPRNAQGMWLEFRRGS